MHGFPVRIRRATLAGRANLSNRRRGVAIVMVVVSLPVLAGVAALTIDLGYLQLVRQELQISADSAAMAAAWELLDTDRLRGWDDPSQELAAAKARAAEFAAGNLIMRRPVNLDLIGDVQIGYMEDPSDPAGVMTFADPKAFNTVSVVVRRDAGMNGPINLLFAGIFGLSTTDVSARAAAIFKDGVRGFRVTPDSGNSSLMPLALHIDAWTNLLNGTFTHGDNYGFDENLNTVTANPDGVQEISMYPNGGEYQLPPGSFGTVDIGVSGNSTAVVERQIVDGVNADDLAHYGGELALGDDGTLTLTGDTGLSAGMKDSLVDIIGLPRTIPLFDTVVNPGNNAEFRIVGFAGIRIVAVKLTGAMNKKYVLIQPSFVVDATAVTGPGTGTSYYVYEPVRLVQ